MSKITWKGSAQLGPIPPTMVTVGDMENSNIITIGWTGIINTVPPKTYISVRPERHSFEILKNTGEFAVNLTPTELVAAADWCGVHTGRKVDKFEKCNLTKEAASQISCPIIKECPLALECKIFDEIDLGSHRMFLADIVAVDVDEKLIDENGKLRLDKSNLAAYAHGDYFELGRKIGSRGFAVAKKNRKNNPQKAITPKKNPTEKETSKKQKQKNKGAKGTKNKGMKK